MRYRNKIVCFIGLLLLFLLVAGAFWLPQFLFDWKDRERMQEVGRGSRQDITYAALEAGYEGTLQKRLNRLARGMESGTTYYVSEVSYSLSWEEKVQILQEIFQKTPYELLMMSGLLSVEEEDLLEIPVWKKYVVYDADGIDLICWYIEIVTAENPTVQRILADEKDRSIYALRSRLGFVTPFYETAKKTDAAMAMSDGKPLVSVSKDVWAMLEIFMDYYDAQWDPDTLSVEWSTDRERIAYDMPVVYEGEKLTFELSYPLSGWKNGDYGEYEIGFPEIAGLIPELRQ